MAYGPSGHTADAIDSLDSAVAAIGAACETIDALLPYLDDDQRRRVVTLAGDVGRANDALRLRIAHDVVQRHDGLPKDERFTVTSGYRDPAQMLTAELGASRHSVRRLLSTTAAVRPTTSLTGATVPARFAVLGATVERGVITIDQAGTIVEALGDVADRANPEHVEAAERALVDSAVGERGMHPAETGLVGQPMPPELLAKVARMWRERMDPDGVEPRYEEQLKQRYFAMRTLADGTVTGDFRCTPDQGAVLSAAFDVVTTPRKPVFLSDEERALAELVEDDRTRGQKMIDGLIAMVSVAAEQKDAPRIGGEAPTVVLHLSEATYRAAADGGTGGTVTDERTGADIPIHIATATMCDGHIQAVVTGADGMPLHLGRTQRLFSRWQRRALAARDKGCRAPGCDAPVSWCETHHVTFWSLGGLTDIDNGIMLCAHHHHEVHRETLEVVQGPSGWIVVPKTRPPRRRRGWAPSLDPAALYLQPAA